MLFSQNFPVLLASLLLAFSVGGGVDARPTKSKRDDGMVHMPLTRSHNLARTDVHPHLLYQQHANRGHRRLARMTGRSAPSDIELRSNMEKRMFLLPGGGPGALRPDANTTVATTRRYFADGIVRGSLAALRAGAKTTVKRDLVSDIEALLGSLGQGLGQGQGAAAGAGAGAAAGDGTAAGTTATGKHGGKGGKVAASSTAAAAGAAPTATGNGTATTGTSAGFNSADLTAANNGGLTNSVVKDSNGTTGLAIEANDVGYIATIQIGTPPKSFRTLMDSGSADFWVGATACKDSTSGAACGNQHTFLGTATSSSFVDSKKPFQVTYGSGAVAGTIITDNVVMAGLTLNAHTFGASSVESPQFSGNDIDFDGLIGLAQSTLSNQGVLTPVESLAKQGSISSAITSFKISRLSDAKNDGQVTFGGLDATKFDAATLVSIPNVSKTGFWEGAVDAFTVNGKDLGLTGRTAILDTGTTLIIAPAADAAAVHAAIPGAASDGQGGFTLPCTTTASFALSFGGKSFAIQPSDLTFLPVKANDLTGDCISGISSGNVGGAQEWLVGDVFLKNAYFSTDVTKNTVSLAKLV